MNELEMLEYLTSGFLRYVKASGYDGRVSQALTFELAIAYLAALGLMRGGEDAAIR